jgi:nicotinate-nucleotide pyrophosphorylase (carboxylating)
MGLYDMILVKDNHVDYAGGMVEAIRNVQRYFEQGGTRVPVEVEVRDMQELREALDASEQLALPLKRILLDNFHPDAMKDAVRWVDGRVPLEASGGIDLSNLREYGETGVDFVSMGALTHSVKSLDLSLKTQPKIDA